MRLLATRRRKLAAGAVTLALAGGAIGYACSTNPPPQPAGQSGWTTLVMGESFAGTTLDQFWNESWGGGNPSGPVNTSETACYNSANVAVNNGLTLTLNATPAKCKASETYSGALLDTDGHFTVTPGEFVEASISMQGDSKGITAWPAFWLDGQNWPTTGEIDVMEGLDGPPCAHFHGPPSGTGYGVCAAGAWTNGYHTYGVDWENGSLTFYYDGVFLWQDNTGITSAPEYLILDLTTDRVVAMPVTMKVAYVRVWKR